MTGQTNHKPATAVIADDHAIIRDGIRRAIESQTNVSVLAEAEDGLEAIQLVRMHRPTLLTLDMAMPKAQGLEVFEEVRRWSPDTFVLTFTGQTSTGMLNQLIEAGVDGLFAKQGNPTEFIDAIPRILNGEKIIATEIKSFLTERTTANILTARERQILAVLITGASNQIASERLGISAKTVDNHRTNLMRKLEVHSFAELLAYAVREGLLDGHKEL